MTETKSKTSLFNLELCGSKISVGVSWKLVITIKIKRIL